MAWPSKHILCWGVRKVPSDEATKCLHVCDHFIFSGMIEATFCGDTKMVKGQPKLFHFEQVNVFVFYINKSE